MYKVVKISDSTTAAALHNGVQYEQHAVIQFLVAEKESVRNIHKPLCNVYGSAAVDRSTVGRWVKIVIASKRGTAVLHGLAHLA
jgi:hypothetical protein